MILGVRNFELFIRLCLSVAGREYAKSTHEWLLPRLALLLAGGTLISKSATTAAHARLAPQRRQAVFFAKLW